MDGTPNYIDWINSQILENGTVAVHAIATLQANFELRGIRAEGKNFVGESVGSIEGFKENGAIMHYSAKNE